MKEAEERGELDPSYLLSNPIYRDDPELIQGQIRLDGMHLFQRCALSLGSTPQELFGAFPREATQKTLVALMARPWFQRIWVIQEFVAAKRHYHVLR
jgi:hypothetical protein